VETRISPANWRTELPIAEGTHLRRKKKKEEGEGEHRSERSGKFSGFSRKMSRVQTSLRKTPLFIREGAGGEGEG